ncbi:MAG: hypothetical protein H7245_17750 [Candidatus Saccharibacteria bacterium]|nr:hypothetical protein [Pseudorhodobacter sp.]
MSDRLSMRSVVTLLVGLALTASAALADPQTLRNGDDLFLSGVSATETLTAPRDVLAAGATVNLRGSVAHDAHATGFDVEVEAATGGSVYAAGATVTQRGTVGQDLTASGFTVRTTPEAVTTGNARLSGGVVTIEGPVTGALTASGGEVVLNAAVGGDVVLAAGSLRFGPAARIGGTLRYFTGAAVEIPASVVAPDRVTFVQVHMTNPFRDMGGMGRDRWPRMPGMLSVMAGFAVTLGFLTLLGAMFLTFVPSPVEALRRSALARPGRCLIAGFLGLACLFGLVPVGAMTIIGLPLVPFVLLAVIVLWTLAYLLGAYALALRVVQAAGVTQEPGVWGRVGALTGGLIVVALLNFIPVVGWMINLTLVLWGLGAMVLMMVAWKAGPSAPAPLPKGHSA